MSKKKGSKNRKEARQPEVDCDYAAAADSFVLDSSDGDDEQQRQQQPEKEGSYDDHHQPSGEDDSENDSSDDGDDSEQESESVVGDEKEHDGPGTGSGDDDDDESSSEDGGSSDDDDDEEEEHEDNRSRRTTMPLPPPAASATGEQCTFDLRNLLAVNSHQVDPSLLYCSSRKKKKKPSASSDKVDDADERLTIAPPSNGSNLVLNEEYLLEKATDGCTQLVAALWQLPVERSDAGPPMATLPSYDDSRIPRALPLPPPRQETKWEKFAKERRLPLNKQKRSRKVWDEATGQWLYRTGYQKANDDDGKEWPIMEVKDNEDPYEDPWERRRDAKRARVEKNMESRMRNQERAGILARGTTNKVVKNREKIRRAGKEGGNMDRDNVPPSGVPVDMQAWRGKKGGGGVGDDGAAVAKQSIKLRGKASTAQALLATQRSTASLGKFDKMIEGEPERTKALSVLKKRKYESATDGRVIKGEVERNVKVMKNVVSGGGGVAKEKAIRKGKLSYGETAYDYDFDDGLGPSNFRKKKGRAGAGKQKKMTKKRIK